MPLVFFSLLDSTADPVRVCERAAELGIPAVALSDHGNVGGMVDHWKAAKKNGILPIAGCELYLAGKDPRSENGDPGARRANGRPYPHLVTLSKSLTGWKRLIGAVSRSWDRDHFYHSPRSSLEGLRDFTHDRQLIGISGHPGSEIANCVFTDFRQAYNCRTEGQARAFVAPDAKRVLRKKVEEYLSVLGRGNFFLEVQVLDPDAMPASLIVANAVRWAAAKFKVPAVATGDSHYVSRKDAYDQKVLLCSKLKTTLSSVQKKIALDEEVDLGGFFRSDCFAIPSYEDLTRYNTPGEIENTLRVAELCEAYDILSGPKLPDFPCPDGLDAASYLRLLCEEGFRRLIEGRLAYLDRPQREYRDRLETELGVVNGAGLAAYFLIVQDVVSDAKGRGWLCSPGRGSSAGCLISYLIGITAIDPLPFDLLFERFLNAGRFSEGKISLPDIDVDLPVIKRDVAYHRLQKKYGEDRVAKIATYQGLMGRSALDTVLSVHEVDFETRKRITSLIPDQAKIAEELQEMRDRGESPSIIRYALQENADDLAEWVRMNDDGSLEGEMAGKFAQAIRLEGTKKNISTHAAGVVISTQPLSEVCPLKWDEKSGGNVAMMDGVKLEALGLCKIDILGVAMLNKSEGVRELALTGEITVD